MFEYNPGPEFLVTGSNRSRGLVLEVLQYSQVARDEWRTPRTKVYTISSLSTILSTSAKYPLIKAFSTSVLT